MSKHTAGTPCKQGVFFLQFRKHNIVKDKRF